MPTEPRLEPTVDELSAYLDNELDAAAQERIAAHLAGCPDCEARLEGLRRTAYAIRALPLETPPRSFTVPEQRRQGWNWAPAGWIASAAAAVLVIVVGINQLHPGAGGTASTSSGGAGFNQPSQLSNGSVGAADKGAYSAQAAAPFGANRVTVIDPRNSSRQLTVSSDRPAYPANGVVQVTGSATGDRSGQITIVLRRGSYGVRLADPQTSQSTPGLVFSGSYALSQLPLIDPKAGSYTLTVTWTSGSGATLIAELPLTITG
jgi:anti-sigma factor RsiW